MTTATITDPPATCTLQTAVGVHEACPGERCPFWHGDACAVAGLHADLGLTAGLPELLLRIRNELGEHAPTQYGLLPPGLR